MDMKIEIEIDESCPEPKILIKTNQITEEIQLLIKKLSEESSLLLTGVRNDTLKILEPQEIIRIYSSGGKTFAATSEGEYSLRLRLYELENRLEKLQFVRISNSEIVNLKKVKGFDVRFSGTVCVSLQDGGVTYVSRRYVKKLKQILGI